ncbi:hypothetical protein DASC09_026380 [Saccharomycopsis crataegensis]|uniref:C2H2-type domain-containing protein n=1 Tax=Saccharomycopsis crataegensis TaxID=43959 RepID=A0AAV5QKD1_9ASCO|nr:hypothetical protein DASC09_026380 [Saccharomycopsis crataegensis]
MTQSRLTDIEYDRLVSQFAHDKNSKYYKLCHNQEIVNYLQINRKRGLYNCNHCKHSFANVYELALHFDFYNVNRQYYCDSYGCPYAILGFASSNECNRHLNSVHGEKNHVCCECGVKFSRIDQLNAHVSRTHRNPHSRFNKKLSKQNSTGKFRNNFPVDSLSSSISAPSSSPSIMMPQHQPLSLKTPYPSAPSSPCYPQSYQLPPINPHFTGIDKSTNVLPSISTLDSRLVSHPMRSHSNPLIDYFSTIPQSVDNTMPLSGTGFTYSDHDNSASHQEDRSNINGTERYHHYNTTKDKKRNQLVKKTSKLKINYLIN